MDKYWINGKLVNKEQASISVFDHGLLYGDGIFEGIRFYKHVPFCLEAHLKRLHQSALAIGLTLPYNQEEFKTAINAVIEKFSEADGYLRLVVTRGQGSLGINPNSCPRATAFIIADQLSAIAPQVLQRGAKLIIASTRRLPADGLDPRLKSLNYLNNVLAKMEANQAGVDEAVLLNAQGYVTEGSTNNIFIVRDGQLFTPPVIDGALDGITRKLIINLAAELNIACCEKSLAAYDLYTADECFLTGTAVELVAVREIGGRQLPTALGPVFTQLHEAFKNRIAANIDNQSITRVAS
ncbi:Branched-chain amino acid aminotransferase [hydrothermal vent metagenome]|uniref:branched-chain-amino-acid transaminase n=1 Tax=hydrothermal vent metagenome TaxID=652676 RepID=A0A3B1B6L3_9ZZZZ